MTELNDWLSNMSSDVLALNEYLSAAVSGETLPEPSYRDISSNPLVAEFESLWAWLGGPDLRKEFRFDEQRRWRFDYVHLQSNVAIELEGGIWSNGRHVRGQGFINDCEKYNRAIVLGYVVFRLPADLINEENVQPIIDMI